MVKIFVYHTVLVYGKIISLQTPNYLSFRDTIAFSLKYDLGLQNFLVECEIKLLLAMDCRGV